MKAFLRFFIFLSVMLPIAGNYAMEIQEVVEVKEMGQIPMLHELSAQALLKKMIEDYQEKKDDAFADLKRLPEELRLYVLATDVPGYEATLLHLMVLVGENDQIKFLLKLEAPVDVHDDGGKTPLHYAASKNNVDAITMLLDHGASIDVRGKFGETPLFDAVSENNIEAINALIERGASIEAENKFGGNPLHIAASKGNLTTVQALLDHLTDKKAQEKVLNKQDKLGVTPLMGAAMQNDTEIVKALLGAGADKSIQTATGLTAQDLAQGDDEIARLIAEWPSK